MKRPSNSFVLTAKARDGETFEVRSTVDSLRVYGNEGTLTGCQFTFYRRSGGTIAPYSCHWALYRRTGSAYSRVGYSGYKQQFYYLTSASTTSGGTLADAFVMFIADDAMSASGFASQAPGSYLAKKEVTIVRQGDTGATGPSYYMAGRFARNTEYTCSEQGIPIVFMDDATSGVWNMALQAFGRYWYLKADTNLVDGTYHEPGDDAGQYWGEAQGVSVTVSGANFADFAKNGAGVMAGDYFYSANGRIDGQEQVDGVGADGNAVSGSNPPAYTRFMGDPTAQEGSFSQSGLSGPLSSDRAVLLNIVLPKGVTLTVTINGRTAASGTTGYFAIYYKGQRVAGTVQLGPTASTVVLTVTAAAVGAYTVEYYGGTTATSVTFSASYGVTGHFYPNWWVDLKTGKMHAARGNFVLNADGSVTAAAGNFVISDQGDVTVEGVVKAKTLYQTMKTVGLDYEDCSSNHGSAYAAHVLDSADLLAKCDGVLPSVLSLVSSPDLAYDPTQTGHLASFTVWLPDPEAYPGHQLTVIATGLYKYNGRYTTPIRITSEAAGPNNNTVLLDLAGHEWSHFFYYPTDSIEDVGAGRLIPRTFTLRLLSTGGYWTVLEAVNAGAEIETG